MLEKLLSFPGVICRDFAWGFAWEVRMGDSYNPARIGGNMGSLLGLQSEATAGELEARASAFSEELSRAA